MFIVRDRMQLAVCVIFMSLQMDTIVKMIVLEKFTRSHGHSDRSLSS